jgi:hypothetical protein
MNGTALRTGNVKIGFPFTVHGNKAALRAASLLTQAGHRFAARNVVQPSETWHEPTNQPTTTPINDKDIIYSMASVITNITYSSIITAIIY